MVDAYDTGPIMSAAMSGIGMGIIAGTTIRTMDMMEQSLYRRPSVRTRFESKVYQPWPKQKRMSYHPYSARRMKTIPIKVWRPTKW